MKKGISLVALVITIILLIILTAAVVLTFQGDGLIERADQAVEDSNDAVLEEKITMMNLEYTQKMKKKFTPETRETLKAIVKQSRIDLDKLLVYYDVNEEQHVFYKIDKVTKKDVEWFLENDVNEKTIYWLIGDINLDGEINKIDEDIILDYVAYPDQPELPADDENYVFLIGDVNGDGSYPEPGDRTAINEISKRIEKLYNNTIIDLSVKEEQLKIYFGIE